MMMVQEASNGDFIAYPVLVFAIIVLVVVAAVFWYNTHCPNCKRLFTREVIKKEKGGMLPTVISGKERRYYRCKHCGHEWDKVHHVE